MIQRDRQINFQTLAQISSNAAPYAFSCTDILNVFYSKASNSSRKVFLAQTSTTRISSMDRKSGTNKYNTTSCMAEIDVHRCILSHGRDCHAPMQTLGQMSAEPTSSTDGNLQPVQTSSKAEIVVHRMCPTK